MFNLALIAVHLSEADEAYHFVERAIRRDPAEVLAWRLKAVLAAALDRGDEAGKAERIAAEIERGQVERRPQVIDGARVFDEAGSASALKPMVTARNCADPDTWDLDVDRKTLSPSFR